MTDRFFWIAPFFLILGCSKPRLSTEASYTSQEIEAVATNVQVPRNLWQDIEAEYKRRYSAGTEAEIEFRTVNLRFLPVSVYLREESEGVLRTDALRLRGTMNGVFVDFANLVNSRKSGLFFLSLEVDQDLLAPETPPRVYFIPGYASIQLSETQYGVGCERYLDITEFFYDQLSQEGLVLSSINKRYLLSVGGTFLLVRYESGRISLAHWSFYDSESQLEKCPTLGEFQVVSPGLSE